MVNMNVPYVRPAKSLTQLQRELNDVWPTRQADLGFVTGYKSASNFTGHNPNDQGIVMAYDIGTYVDGQINEPAGRALADFLRTDCNEKLEYIIHDMSEGAPRPMIAGNHTNWEWVDYTGADAHSNHIHISIVDLYWGDPTAVPASVYDSESSWGIASRFKSGISGQGSKIIPIEGDPFSMASLDDLANAIKRPDVLSAIAAAVLQAPVSWFGYDGKPPATGRKTTDLQTVLGWSDANIRMTQGKADAATKAANAAVAAVKATPALAPVELTAAQLSFLADKLNEVLPASTVAALAKKLA